MHPSRFLYKLVKNDSHINNLECVTIKEIKVLKNANINWHPPIIENQYVRNLFMSSIIEILLYNQITLFPRKYSGHTSFGREKSILR